MYRNDEERIVITPQTIDDKSINAVGVELL